MAHGYRAIVYFLAAFALQGCAKKAWVSDDGKTDRFPQDRYACMQESQQPVSQAQVNQYGGYSQGKIITNDAVFAACMNAKGWKLTIDRENRTNPLGDFVNAHRDYWGL